MKPIKVDYEKNIILMTRKFFDKAQDPRSSEYAELQRYKADNPTFRVVRHTIKKNPNKECYKGLTYEYIREYIKKYERATMVEVRLKELEDKIFLTKCHTIRYPAIKKWFLETYPEVVEYGMVHEQIEEKKTFDLEPIDGSLAA